MKGQIDQMFDTGFIYKNPDGSLGISQSEEERAFNAESAAKQPKVPNQLNLSAAQSAVRNLEGAFGQVVPGDDDEEQY
jgi:hypothetical protein